MGTRLRDLGAPWYNLDLHTRSSHQHCMEKLWIFSDFCKNFMLHIMTVRTGSNPFGPVQRKHKFLEPWTGPSVQFSNFPELWTELCVRFMAVQVRTIVQNQTLTPLCLQQQCYNLWLTTVTALQSVTVCSNNITICLLSAVTTLQSVPVCKPSDLELYLNLGIAPQTWITRTSLTCDYRWLIHL